MSHKCRASVPGGLEEQISYDMDNANKESGTFLACICCGLNDQGRLPAYKIYGRWKDGAEFPKRIQLWF